MESLGINELAVDQQQAAGIEALEGTSQTRLVEAEKRAVQAERQRDEAEANTAALEEKLRSVRQVAREHQDAIKGMHQAHLIPEGDTLPLHIKSDSSRAAYEQLLAAESKVLLLAQELAIAAGGQEKDEAVPSGVVVKGEETETAERANESRGKKRLRQAMPLEPAKPPGAFDIFVEEKWSALVGDKVQRKEQAALMWKAVPANDLNYWVAKAKAIKDRYNLEMQVYHNEMLSYKEALPPKEKAALHRNDNEKRKEEALQQKAQIGECRDALKKLGARLKESLQVRKIRRERYAPSTVLPGSFVFPNINMEKFDFIFSKFRSNFSPPDWTVDTPKILGKLSGDDPKTIFGVGNTTHKGWCATFVVHELTVTYDPITAELNLAYRAKEVKSQ